MDAEKRNEELSNKLESYLNQACEAESERDFEKAERCFKFAFFQEGKLRPEVDDAKKYVTEAGPVYENISVAVSIEGSTVHQN